MRNIERKVALRDRAATEALVKSAGAEFQWTKHQRDTFFRVQRGWLKLREQEGSGAELIAYQRSEEHSGPRPSDYELLPVVEPERWIALLSRACPVEIVVEKWRSLWTWRHTRIHLDRVDGLGDFLELETVLDEDGGFGEEEGRAEIAHLSSMLDLSRETGLRVPYRTLLLDRRLSPMEREMVLESIRDRPKDEPEREGSAEQ